MTKNPKMRKLPLTYENRNMVEGRYFSAGQLFTDVAENGGKVQFILENPADSQKILFVDPQNIRTEAKTFVRKYFNVSYSGGSSTDTGIVNKNSGNDREKEANVLVNPSSFSGGNQLSTKLVGSNAGGIRAGGAVRAVSNVVNPGDNMLLEVENRSAEQEDVSIDIDWLEVSE